MQIDYCLILAAGFGTRMGKIGEQLPKVLWPVFEKSLLELQVRYARSLGIQKIFINLHHKGDVVEAHCKDKETFEGVEFLWEKPEILDIGGAVHNLAEIVKYKGRLLILNADQFFYLKKEELLNSAKQYANDPVTLFNYTVNSSDGYNALEVAADRSIKGLIKNPDLPRDKHIETYTGNSLINLGALPAVKGKSKFFESVANWKDRKVSSIVLKTDYWDFGTIERFWDTSFRILSTYRVNSNHAFLRFLVQERALKTWKINLQMLSYHASSAQVVNLTEDKINKETPPSIVMSGSHPAVDRKGIYWNGLFEEVKQ